MPCTKGMRGCHVRCGHREVVESYRRERDAQLDRAEAASNGHDAELRSFYGDADAPRGDVTESRILFRDHLEALARERAAEREAYEGDAA